MSATLCDRGHRPESAPLLNEADQGGGDSMQSVTASTRFRLRGLGTQIRGNRERNIRHGEIHHGRGSSGCPICPRGRNRRFSAVIKCGSGSYNIDGIKRNRL